MGSWTRTCWETCRCCQSTISVSYSFTQTQAHTLGERRSSKFFTFQCFLFQQIKPTVLIGTSGKGRTFTQDVVEAMASLNEVLYLLIIPICNLMLMLSESMCHMVMLAETYYSCSFQPNISVRMYCRRSLYVDQGNVKTWLVALCWKFWLPNHFLWMITNNDSSHSFVVCCPCVFLSGTCHFC